MGKFVKRSCIYILLILFFSVFFSMLIDPYNIYHYKRIRVHSGESNTRYIKTKYILENPDKFDSFLFGSSRVGYIHTENLNTKENRWYNMTYANGLLPEIKETIKTFIQNGIIPENIMIGIDAVDGANAKVHLDDLMRKPYPTTLMDTVKFHLSYLNPSISFEALFTLEKEGNEDILRQQFYEYGGIYKTGNRNYNWDKVPVVKNELMTEKTAHIESTLQVVKEISLLCKENKINLILFTTPLHVSAYFDSMDQGFLLFIKEAAKIHEIYCFSSINAINTNNENYWEEVHFDSKVGDLILERIFKQEDFDDHLLSQGFGTLLNEDNAEEHYAFLINQYLEYR